MSFKKLSLMKFATFLINIDDAHERRQLMEDQLGRLNIPYSKISAVHGDLLEFPIDGFDETGFKINTGKCRNNLEVGCYLSHITALKVFLESDSDHALILEDDALLPDCLVALLESAVEHSSIWDLLRLSSLREGKFIELVPLVENYHLVINTRVLKSTAAYFISRHGAQRCLERLQPMSWPYDVALDRDWSIGIRTACVLPFPVAFSEMPSQIPKSRRIKFLRATTFHFYHFIDHFQRIIYRRKIARRCQSNMSK